MSDLLCDGCRRPIEEVGPTGEKQFRDVCQDAKRHAGSVLPESILWDPYLYRGFLCCQCGRLACPDCAAVHHDDRCPFCHQETIVFAYRPFLGTRAPRAESAPSYSCPQCGFYHPSWYPRGAWVCPQCNTEIDAQGHALIRRVEHSAMEYSSDSAYWGPSRYAPIWRRAAAALIDGLILACVEVALAIVALVVSGLIKGLLAVPATQIVIAFTVPLLVTLPFWLLIAWLYSALLESSRRRATLGKTALGLMVTTDGGAQINFVRASLRFFAKLLSTLPAGAGFAIAGLTARKQALHDMLARTTVVSGHVVGVEWSVESAATPAAYAPAAARAAMPAPVSADTEAPAAPAADEAETTVFVWPEEQHPAPATAEPQREQVTLITLPEVPAYTAPRETVDFDQSAQKPTAPPVAALAPAEAPIVEAAPAIAPAPSVTQEPPLSVPPAPAVAALQEESTQPLATLPAPVETAPAAALATTPVEIEPPAVPTPPETVAPFVEPAAAVAPAPVSDISAEPARKGPVLDTRVMRAVIRATPLIARAARVEAVEKEGLLAAPEAPAEAPAAPSELPVSSVAIAPPPAAAPPAPAEGAISSVALPASVPPSATPTPPVAPAAVAPPAVAPPAPAPEADEDLPELDETPGSADHTPSAALMARTRPDLYRTNAFRLTGLVVEAASREVARQADRFKMMEKLGQAAQAGGALPVEPPPDAHTLREALQSLNDPERRLLDEVFWFWPRLSGCAAQDGVLQMLQRGEAQQASAEWARQESFESHPYVAVHNMAVLCHALALDLECASAVRPLSAEEIKQRDLYWQEAMRRWRRVVQELRFWRRLLARVRAIDDPRLTAETVHRVRAGLPLALLMINAQLAVRAAEHGDIEEARRHKRVLSSSGFESALVDEALRRAMGPMRDRVEQLCSAAETDIAKDPLNGDQIARRLLDQSRGLLAAFDALLPDGNAARDGAHDDIALRALSAVIAYGNQTKNWPAFRALLEAILKVARGAAARRRIEENLAIVKTNIEYGTCWFCGERKSDDSAAAGIKMYGDVTRTPTWNGVQIQWRHMTVQIPRCPQCRSVHSTAATAFGLLFGGATLLGVGGCALTDGKLVALGFILPIVGGIVGAIIKKVLLGKVKPESHKTAFAGVQEKLKQGWNFGSRPSS